MMVNCNMIIKAKKGKYCERNDYKMIRGHILQKRKEKYMIFFHIRHERNWIRKD